MQASVVADSSEFLGARFVNRGHPIERVPAASGDVVAGVIAHSDNVRGTAGFPVGGKYKVEILRPNIEGWAFLWENHNSIKDGVLMPNFNSGLFPPGAYVLRLMIVDAAGQETGIACRVSFRIAG